MSKLYGEVEEICNRLQRNATRKMNMELKELRACHKGYMQGCEDMLESVREYIRDNKNELQEGTKEDEKS